MSATVGCYAIDDRNEAQEALGLVDQVRDSIGVGMVYDRNFEPITRRIWRWPSADD